MRKLAVASDLSDRSEWVGPGQLGKAARPWEEIARPVIQVESARWLTSERRLGSSEAIDLRA
jgi:hypothetical protein